ncbi:hypothetical protein AB0952_20855 [Streptomyces caniferus]|uniref:hypothetical protein n=1 Tax=Streptomyces caniferus TaxID=285557 RepID=UPI0034523B2A
MSSIMASSVYPSKFQWSAPGTFMNALRITAALRWCISPSHVQVASAVAMNSPVGEGRLCGHENLRGAPARAWPGLAVIDITTADQASATEAAVALGGLWFSSGVSAP